MKRCRRLSAHAEMPGHKAIVGHPDTTIVIIERRTVERITHHLPPMLPACIEMVVVIVVAPHQMSVQISRMVVIDRSALILGIEILHDDSIEPRSSLEFQFCTKHHILEVVEEIAVVFLHIPLLSFAIAIIAEHEH